MADTGPATTAPTINTGMVRSVLKETPLTDSVTAILLEACDAIDILRRQFAGQQHYINGMERRWNAAPHGDDCNKTKNTPCDCWKAS